MPCQKASMGRLAETPLRRSQGMLKIPGPAADDCRQCLHVGPQHAVGRVQGNGGYYGYLNEGSDEKGRHGLTSAAACW